LRVHGLQPPDQEQSRDPRHRELWCAQCHVPRVPACTYKTVVF
jgi:hypothetical protein